MREERVLTKADDYPIHQTPEPIAYAGSDRNFYDRYFFNGYTPDGDVFFAAALGVYPHLNVIDASFSVIVDGKQHALHASRVLGMERMDLQVGSISIEVLEPLQKLKIRVDHADSGLKAELDFSGRLEAFEEPRFTYRRGSRTFLDYTRLTQQGAYAGFIEVGGRKLEIGPEVLGTRDRSWGVRPIGAGDPQPVVPMTVPQFYWLWAPLNFDDAATLYHLNADEAGNAWNTNAAFLPVDGIGAFETSNCQNDIAYKPGTRHAADIKIRFEDDNAGEYRLELVPQFNFYMMGLGYSHPKWGHGVFQGEFAEEYEEFNLADVNEADLSFNHIQAFSKARLFSPDGSVREGRGVLEQLIVGPHKPSGFADLFDLA